LLISAARRTRRSRPIKNGTSLRAERSKPTPILQQKPVHHLTRRSGVRVQRRCGKKREMKTRSLSCMLMCPEPTKTISLCTRPGKGSQPRHVYCSWMAYNCCGLVRYEFSHATLPPAQRKPLYRVTRWYVSRSNRTIGYQGESEEGEIIYEVIFEEVPYIEWQHRTRRTTSDRLLSAPKPKKIGQCTCIVPLKGRTEKS